MKNATKNNTSFKDNASQNDHLYCHIMVWSALYCVQHFTVSRTLLCPAHYCVQHIIVSSKILCPHLPKRSFVHLSHFNVLRSYYVLAKHLSSLWEMQPKITLVLRIMRVKMITYIVILWCVQHFTVSSTDRKSVV